MGPTPLFRSVQTQLSPASCSANWDDPEVAHPHPVVRSGRECEHPTYLFNSAMPYLSHKSNRLQPAETLFDSFPFFLADRVSAVPRRPFIDGAAATALDILGDMRRDSQMPAFG